MARISLAGWFINMWHCVSTMYIGDIIKQYRESNNISVQDFAATAGLSVADIETLENLYIPGTMNPVPVAMRQVKAIAEAMNQPMGAVMVQLGNDQPVVVNVVAESDQPHAK